LREGWTGKTRRTQYSERHPYVVVIIGGLQSDVPLVALA
jgi:hypothetical protein